MQRLRDLRHMQQTRRAYRVKRALDYITWPRNMQPINVDTLLEEMAS